MYSENGLSRTCALHSYGRITAPTNPSISVSGFMSASFVRAAGILHHAEHVTIGSLEVAAGCHIVGVFLALIYLPHQEKVDIVAWNGVVERGRQARAGRRRLDQARRDNDDEVRLVLLIRRTPEQGAEHGN